MQVESLKFKVKRFIMKDFRSIAILMLLLPMMVCAQPSQPSPFKGTLAGERPMDLNQKEKQVTFSGGVSANGLMNTGSTYSPNPEMFITDGSESSVAPPPTGPRKTQGWPGIPFPDPLGDALIPLALLAVAYALARVYRRKRA